MKDQLLKKAIEAQKFSHSPYSNYKVASAVLMEDGQIFTGVNIENASYGATVCAERVAIWKAVSSNSIKKIKEILVLTDANPPWPPCGMCRQVISEFADGNTLVHIANKSGVYKSIKMLELLPLSFTPEHLNKPT